MRILVANDDGINAPGLKTLVEALSEAEVFVFAPESQRSGAGHAISLHKSIDVWPVEYEGVKSAHAVDGTPADCVAIGCTVLEEQETPPDMVISGINSGSNVGTDIVYSGTVAAALEGSIHGYPSIAVSVDSVAPKHYECACRLVLDTIRKTGGSWDSDVVININSPDVPDNEIKGVCVTSAGKREYTCDIQVEKTDGEKVTYFYGGTAVRYEDASIECDVPAVQNGYASITPLHKDMTVHGVIEKLKSLEIGR